MHSCFKREGISPETKYFRSRGILKFLILVFLILLMPTSLADNSDNVVRIGVFPNEPLVSFSENEDVTGPYVDIIGAIAEDEGWEVTYIRGSWEENLERLDNSDIDILVAVPHSPEMDEKYTFTSESITTAWGVAYTYAGSGIRSMQDLQGKQIAVYSSDIFYKDLNASLTNTNTSFQFVEVDSYGEVLELVNEKEADVGIVSNLYGDAFEKEYTLHKMSFVITPTDMVFALPKNSSSQMVETIDMHVEQLKENPTYIYRFSQDSQSANLNTWESPTWLKLTVGIGGGLLLLFIILSFVLKNQIETKTSELNSKNRELEIEVRERMAAEKKLKQYFKQLKHSNELKDLFTDILRHDLINPATVVKGYVEHLLEYEEDEQKTTALKVIERNNLKLIEMIENASRLAKLESVEELDFKELDIGSILEEVIQNLQPKADEKQIEIEFNPEKNYPARVNTIIEEVFSNLISNSIKYSPEGTKVKVKVSEWNNSGWKISISDEGEGISDRDKPLIFDRFERAGKTNIKGTGLGLAIVKRIMELHDGDVGVEDNPSGERGSVFWVTLNR
ncbi:ATP-binding protein [Methanolobus sp. ZRKC2]|uniref:ATP-binding protein n=1 Tax=Methanolobus sp. ZRKC2 TaxID=3125783 RepID=UPI00324E8555